MADAKDLSRQQTGSLWRPEPAGGENFCDHTARWPGCSGADGSQIKTARAVSRRFFFLKTSFKNQDHS
ncbi:hypothetical protein HMPREF3213_03057 [Heyndrickxia coagulans]|uniref:Uncharacterized protein n=1 Tax=Heyndrickxia coagulans TaxID=1398 RepID=A0A133KFE3_HEYCO|nr:hypothetical protein HMPREF3213_03057 [Heyndrickxia coagulans]